MISKYRVLRYRGKLYLYNENLDSFYKSKFRGKFGCLIFYKRWLGLYHTDEIQLLFGSIGLVSKGYTQLI